MEKAPAKLKVQEGFINGGISQREMSCGTSSRGTGERKPELATVQNPTGPPAPTARGLEGLLRERSLLPSLLLSGAWGDGLPLSLNRREEDSRAHVAPQM